MELDFALDVPTVRGDRVQLQQVILNPVLNAADAMCGVDDRRRILRVTTVLDTDDQVRLSVGDAGVELEGIDPDRLFDSFFTTKPEGMGIGLSISRTIMNTWIPWERPYRHCSGSRGEAI